MIGQNATGNSGKKFTVIREIGRGGFGKTTIYGRPARQVEIANSWITQYFSLIRGNYTGTAPRFPGYGGGERE